MLFYSLYALIGFILGSHLLYDRSGYVLIVVGITFLFVLLLFCTIKRFRTFVISALVIGVFSVIGLFCMNINSDVSVFKDEYVTVTGRISEIPYESSGIWCYTVDCYNINYGGHKKEFNSRITVYCENKYVLDDIVDIGGFLELHSESNNPGTFNAYTYYKSMGIDYKITAIEDRFSQNTYEVNTPYAFFNRIRNCMCNIIEENFSADNAAILKVIFTNYRKDLDVDYTNKLLTSGVLRCLYSPYFHLMFMFVLSKLISNKISVQKRRVLMCVACVLYLLVNPYVLTARKLFLFTIICELLRLKGGIFRSIDVLWGVILLCGIQNPFILYNEGFIMSCAATLLIIIFYKKIFRKLSWINTHKKVINILVMFIVSGVIMMPIGAFLFDGISLYSIFISMILMPVINMLYIVSPILFIFKNGLIIGFMNNIVTVIREIPFAVEKIPFSYIILPKPSLAALIGYLVCLGAIYNRKSKKLFVFLLSVSAGIFLNVVVHEINRAGKATITFLTAGQGDCTITDIPYKCTIMVDGGGSAEYNKTYDVGSRDVFPYLRNSNIFDLDYVFVSHYHKDHADGIVSLMDSVKIKNIFLPDCLIENEYRVIIEEKAKKQNIKLHYINGPKVFELEKGVLCEILYFNAFAGDENDTSIVMRITYDGLSCLYTGDITGMVETELLNSGVDLTADVLKVAHHGSKTSSSPEFISAVNPGFAVAMIPEENTYDFPSPETVKTFYELNIPLLTTAEEKCIQIRESKGELIWQRKTH